MKKKAVLISVLCSLALSTIQPLTAVSFKEWAQDSMQKFSLQQILEKAKALAKQLKGVKAKDIWDKINFVERAIDKESAAYETLNICQKKYCASFRNAYVQAYRNAASGPLGLYGILLSQEKSEGLKQAKKRLRRCEKENCSTELDYRIAASSRADKNILALLAIIFTVMFAGAGIVGGSVYFSDPVQAHIQKSKA